MEHKQGRILVVDDHQTNRMMLSLGLQQQGHTTASAENGQQALEMLQNEHFDLVLLDIIMPEMDGYQVLERMKGNHTLRDIPVIVISAMDEMESVIKGIELGAEDYLPKSFDPVLLKARIGACLEKKRLRDNEQLYLKGLERELEIGQQIQAGFLPDQLPQLPGWEIAAHFQAAREVAGDFYDAFINSQVQKVSLVIGDVCDKGVGAALFMTLFRSLIRAVSNMNNFLEEGATERSWVSSDSKTNLEDTVCLTNNYIAYTHKSTNMFTTLFLGLLDPATGLLSYINGGNEPPIIFNASGIKTRLAPTGPVIGIFPHIDFKVKEVYIEPGDTLLAFTDGVTEAKNPNDETFTTEKLLSLLDQSYPSATTLLHHIALELDTHTTGTAQSDDITMLAVRRDALSKTK